MWMRWASDKLWTFVPAQQIVGEFLAAFVKHAGWPSGDSRLPDFENVK